MVIVMAKQMLLHITKATTKAKKKQKQINGNMHDVRPMQCILHTVAGFLILNGIKLFCC